MEISGDLVVNTEGLEQGRDIVEMDRVGMSAISLLAVSFEREGSGLFEARELIVISCFHAPMIARSRWVRTVRTSCANHRPSSSSSRGCGEAKHDSIEIFS